PRLLQALPAVLSGAVVPPTATADKRAIVQRHWYYLDDFLYANLDRFAHYLILARLTVIPLSLLGLWICYRWAWQLYGRSAGLAAGAIYCLCPSLLAHGSLATTDMAATTTVLASVWLWWRFCRAPSAGRWIW